MGFDGPARDGQSKSCASPFPGTRFIDAVEAVKNVWLVFHRYPRPLVNHIENCRVAFALMNTKENRTLGRGILDGVIEKIDDRMAQNQAICEDGNISLSLHVERLALLFGQHFQHGNRFLDNRE